MSWGTDLLRRLRLKRPKKNRLYDPAQHHQELPALLDLAKRSRSYLEIGARHGGTFNAMMRKMPKGSRGVVVDLPGGNWGEESEPFLRHVVEALRAEGYDIHLFLGDSKEPDIVEAVRALGPFDAALIDGDHLYEGVKADWINYGPMARTVIFHDIIGVGVIQTRQQIPVEVPRLWTEIKSSGVRTREVVGRKSTMGLGFVLQ